MAFLPSLKNGFVNRDDPAYSIDNLDIRALAIAKRAAGLGSSGFAGDNRK